MIYKIILTSLYRLHLSNVPCIFLGTVFPNIRIKISLSSTIEEFEFFVVRVCVFVYIHTVTCFGY
jgi:hypothetical protein